jgi:N-acetylglucosaminyldiphosphoundecaprenol N-acetyl-beta-D-mannosaminyltransferase
MPTVWMGRHQGHAMERVFGPDLMLAVLREPRLAAACHYLYGGSRGVAEQLREVLVRKTPGIQIVGTYCPPFRPLTLREQCDLLAEIDRLRPDILWVGLSTPKQEKFMAEFLPKLKTTLMVGVGAAFDFHTGGINDSPTWLKHMGLQWLHRLIQEPSRLWRRYLVNNSQFLCEAFMQIAGLKEFRLNLPVLPGSVASESTHTHPDIG